MLRGAFHAKRGTISMNKIKTLLKNYSEHFRRVINFYPMTAALILLTSVTTAIFIDQSSVFCRLIENKGIPFLILWGIGTFFIETCLREKTALKWCGAAATGIIAVGFIHFGGQSSETVNDLISHWQMAYVIILITLAVYRNAKNSGLPFSQFCVRTVHELSRLAIICGITALGIALVMATFVTLILSGSHYMLIIRAEFLVLGCIFGCGLLDAQIRMDRELPRFFTVIVKYLLMILLTAAFAIIYGYILKIVITRVVPSNEIFRILAGLFIIGLPIWTMAGSFEPDHPLVRISVKLPYIFIPFLFLQGYAIRERILAFGLTPLRCLCLALMAFEIIYILVYALRRRETGVMLPVLAGMALICLALPYVNIFSLSNRSQKAIFDRFITAEFTALSNDEQSALAGSYYYLAGNADGKAMLAGIDPEKIDAIKTSGKTGIREYDQNTYFDFEFPVKNEDISGYSRMTMVLNTNFYGNNTKEKGYDPASVVFYDKEGTKVLTANLSEFINRCISSDAANEAGTPDFPGTVRLEDGSLLLVTHCVMNMNQDKAIQYLYIEAILLE